MINCKLYKTNKLLKKTRHAFFLLTAIGICSGLYPAPIFAQSTYLPHYTTKNGLASNNCYSILQDKKGFIWIATDGGLSRFDGTNFQNFSIEDGLPDTQILQIKEDKQGKLWFLTLNGQIGYLFNGKFYNEENSKLLKALNFNTVIVSFLQDRKNNIWLGTNSNLIIRYDGKTVKKYISKSANDKFTNAFIHEDTDGNIYAFSNSNVQQFIKDDFKLIKLDVNPLSYKSAFNTPIHSLNYIDNSGLKEFKHQKKNNLISIPEKLIKNSEGYFYFDELAKEVWLSNKNGAVQINNQGKINTYLNNITVNQTIKDDHKNIWFATVEGIFMLPNINGRLRIFDQQSGLSSNQIKSITKDGIGRLWLGMDKASINTINTKTFKIGKIEITDQKKFSSIKQITFDSLHQFIYFSSDYGLGVFKDIDHVNPKASYLKETNDLLFVIKHFSLNNSDNKLALALSSGVVFLNDRINNLEYNSLKYRETADFFKNRAYHTFYDQEGNLWFSNINGLSEFTNGKLIKHYEKNTLLTKRINDIQQLSDGTLVLATDGYGLFFYKNGKIIKQLTKNQGLTSDICNKLFIKKDEIWLTTNHGINKISGFNTNTKIVNFDYGKDLLTDDVNNLFVDDSTAYFATNRGLILLNYSLQKYTKNTPRIYITSITKNKIRLPINKQPFEFDYDNKTILFTFSAVDFTTTDITYRYRLDTNSEWVETRTRRLDFTSLQPGKYNFEVSAKNQNGIWSTPAKVAFTIKKAFWQSLWFLAFFILLIGYLFYKLAVYITRKQKDKEQQELLVKNKILMLEQQALQAMMNPHFVFNVMNSIQHYINTQNTTSANKVLTGFARLIRKNLEICTKSYISIEEELEYLELYLKLEQNRFGDKLRYQITLDESIDKDETLIPSMLLQPYVENAIWHGIMPKEKGGTINIQINKQKENLIIEIIDDGIGIDKSLARKNEEHISKGMQITKERLYLLGQIEAKPIQLKIFQTGDSGTKVYISIPL